MNSELKMIMAGIKTLGRAKTPKGITSKEIVVKAIEFGDPPRIPFSFNTHKSDLLNVLNFSAEKKAKKGKRFGETYEDIWGVTWEITEKDWDHAVGHPLKDLGNLKDYIFPDFHFDKVDGLTRFMIRAGKKRSKYILGVNYINMFELLRSLMGFEGAMMAPYLEPELLRQLLYKLAELTCGAIDHYILCGGIDGFITYEDWGLQKGLQLSIEQFRDFYKPVYKKIIDHCHSKGVHFHWHSCGDIITLIPEMVDINVDVVQMDQPRLMGYENLIKASRGKLCFFNCIDNQWSAFPETSIEDIKEETERMIDVYTKMMPHGGLIMKHYLAPWDIGLSKEKEMAIADTFFKKAYIVH